MALNIISQKQNRKLILTVFVLFFLVNIITNGGHFDSWDGIETFLVTESMVVKNTAMLDPTVPSIDEINFDIKMSINTHESIQGKPHSDPLEPIFITRSLLLSTISVPFYWLAQLSNLSPIAIVAISVNSLILALTSTIIFQFAFELYNSKRKSLILALIFGITSFVWPYATSMFPQPLQGLLIIAALYFIYHNTQKQNLKNIILSSSFLGLSVLAHPSSVIVIPGFLIYSYLVNKNTKKKFLVYVITLIGIAMLILLLNDLRFESPTNFGYGQYGSIEQHNGWIGLLGLIFSPGAGIIFFFPAVIMIPFALKFSFSKRRAFTILLGYIVCINWIYYGTLGYGEPFAWSGAGGWGPRYLISVIPVICILLGSILESKHLGLKIILGVLSVVGFIVNLLGALVWYMYGYSYGWGKEGLWQEANSLEVMTWNPVYSPIIFHAKILFSDYLTSMEVPRNVVNYLNIGLAPCALDSYIFCKFSFVPILVSLVIMTILGWRILQKEEHFR
jgi:hypothetical protein